MNNKNYPSNKNRYYNNNNKYYNKKRYYNNKNKNQENGEEEKKTKSQIKYQQMFEKAVFKLHGIKLNEDKNKSEKESA